MPDEPILLVVVRRYDLGDGMSPKLNSIRLSYRFVRPRRNPVSIGKPDPVLPVRTLEEVVNQDASFRRLGSSSGMIADAQNMGDWRQIVSVVSANLESGVRSMCICLATAALLRLLHQFYLE